MCVHVGLRVVVGLVRVLEVDCLLDWRPVLPTPPRCTDFTLPLRNAASRSSASVILSFAMRMDIEDLAGPVRPVVAAWSVPQVVLKSPLAPLPAAPIPAGRPHYDGGGDDGREVCERVERIYRNASATRRINGC
jgi:hypothetical protein